AAICQVHLIVTQLHITQDHLPGFAGRCWLVGTGRCQLCGLLRSGRFGRGCYWFGWCGSAGAGATLTWRWRWRWFGFGGLAGQQSLPVELAIGLAGGSGFQLLATDLADDDLLLVEVHAGFADIQACQAQQRFVCWALDGEVADA